MPAPDDEPTISHIAGSVIDAMLALDALRARTEISVTTMPTGSESRPTRDSADEPAQRIDSSSELDVAGVVLSEPFT